MLFSMMLFMMYCGILFMSKDILAAFIFTAACGIP